MTGLSARSRDHEGRRKEQLAIAGHGVVGAREGGISIGCAERTSWATRLSWIEPADLDEVTLLAARAHPHGLGRA